MKVWHLFHSGVLVETESEQLFFDVISDIEGLIDLKKKQYFFVSHMHADHFSMNILKAYMNKAYFILSDEIVIQDAFKGCDHTLFVRPNEVYDTLPFKISTYDSTDLGVSFLIEVDQKTIFHSGDLNWWHWENATEEVQAEEARQFKKIVNEIKAKEIDIAFVPVDPRLNGAYDYTVRYFLDQKNIQYLVPIHFNEHYEIVDQLLDENKNECMVRIKAKNTLILDLE